MNTTQTIIYIADSEVTILAEFEGYGELNIMTSNHIIDNAVQISGLRVHEVKLQNGEFLFAWGDESIEYKLFINGVQIPNKTYEKESNNVVVENAVDAYTKKTLTDYWYKSIGEVAAIIQDINSIWNREAIAINEWYNNCYELLHAYKNGNKIMTPEQFINTLPVFNFKR